MGERETRRGAVQEDSQTDSSQTGDSLDLWTDGQESNSDILSMGYTPSQCLH